MKLVMLKGGVEEGAVYATGYLPDGSRYLAVADDWAQLHEQIREYARAEGWTGWALMTGMTAVQ